MLRAPSRVVRVAGYALIASACSARALTLTPYPDDSGGSGGSAGSLSAADASDSNSGGDAPIDTASGNDASSASCASGYVDWFRSSFATVDRAVIGTADFPSMPWVTTGSLRLSGGQLSGRGSATASQGLTFAYDGLRLRYKGRFSDSSQRVTIALNQLDDSSGGLRIEVDAAGNIALFEGDVERTSDGLNPLETDRDWFVEADFDAGRATVQLSQANYASQGGFPVIALLETAPLETALGKKLSIALASAGDLLPAIDEIFVSRCGLPAPEYQPVFVDGFERADSSVLGNADLPATSAWNGTSTDILIARGALYFGATGGLATAAIGSKVVNEGLRLRFAFHAGPGASGGSLLLAYNYSGTPNAPGFFLTWNDATSTRITIGESNNAYPFAFESTELRYVQIDADGSNAILTVRSGSHGGQTLAVQSGSGLAAFAAGVEEILLSGQKYVSVDDIEIARYAP